MAQLANTFTEIVDNVLIGKKDMHGPVLYGKIAWQEIKDCTESQIERCPRVVWLTNCFF
jgi:hypothetical protein